MANYRTYKLLTPYKGYSILRQHKDGEWFYYAHKMDVVEKDYIDYLYGPNKDNTQLTAMSLKEIRKSITGDIDAEFWITKANEYFFGA